jgi:hypothetical protein
MLFSSFALKLASPIARPEINQRRRRHNSSAASSNAADAAATAAAILREPVSSALFIDSAGSKAGAGAGVGAGYETGSGTGFNPEGISEAGPGADTTT